MSTPYGMPPTPPKSRMPLYVGLACGCALLLVLVVGVVGVGLFLIGEDAEEGPEPTSTTSPTDPGPSGSPSEHPTTGLETDQPADKPTEGPSTESQTDNREFLGVDITIENQSSQDNGFATRSSRFYAPDGEELRMPVGD